VQGLLIGCLFVSIALFTVVFIDYLHQESKNNYIEWDVKTLTSGDYSVEFDIPKEFYDKFIEEEGPNKDPGMTMIVHFRNWISSQMEFRLTQMPDLGFEDDPFV